MSFVPSSKFQVPGSLLALMLVGVVAACQSPVPAASPAAEVTPKTAVGKMTKLLLSVQKKAVDTVGQYVDVGPSTNSRGVTEPKSLTDIGRLLPSDLSTLRRTVAQSRGVEDNTVVTLQSELDEIVSQFRTDMNTLLPDPTPALTLPGVTIDSTFVQLTGNDPVALASPEGIFLVESLNSQARGEEPAAYSERMQNDLDSILGADSARGLYKISDKIGRWANNRVEYWWGGMSEPHKALVRAAMAEWTTKTKSRITFSQLGTDGWTVFLTWIGVQRVTYITDKASIDGGLVGLTNQNYPWREVKLLDSQTDASYALTARHELGHVLGLQHEHQRADRDLYVTSSAFGNRSLDAEYGIIPATVWTKVGGEWRWASRTISTWWGSFSISWWFWEDRYEDRTYSERWGPFDYHSIMLYTSNNAGYPIYAKKNFSGDPSRGPGNGQYFIFDADVYISSTDVDTVLSLYP